MTDPADGVHTIVIRVTPTAHGQVAVSTHSTHPDQRWTARVLQLAAQAAQIREDGPAITSDGIWWCGTPRLLPACSTC